MVVMALLRLAVLHCALTLSEALAVSLRHPLPAAKSAGPFVTHDMGYGCPSGGEKPKVAVCVYGLARMLPDPDVSNGIRKHLANSEHGRGLRGPEPDVFFHLKLGDSPRKSTFLPGQDAEPMSAARTEVEAAVQRANATRYVIEDGAGPYAHNVSVRQQVANKTCFWNSFFKYHNHVGRCMNMMYSLQGCHGLLEAEEKATGSRYDIVVFQRPDILWSGSLPPSLFVCNHAHFQRDWFQVVPRSGSEFVGYMLRDYFLSPTPRSCRPYSSEHIFRLSLGDIANATGVEADFGFQFNDIAKVKRPDGSLFDR